MTEMVVNAGWGLGEGVGEGVVEVESSTPLYAASR